MSADAGDDWKKLSNLLDQALELPTEDREAWLIRLRAESPEIAARLDGLLHNHSVLKDRHFMEGGVGPTRFDAAQAGQTVGQYTLESPVGTGGMGSVWLARRSDGRFEGHVAIKFLHLEALGGPAARRFAMEGRLLATLAHPNIARLLDAGVTSTEQPYLVLEYVEGKPIDEYCDDRRLSIDERVRLFQDVLAAVAHAHARLIVHRDIKPSNIYVTSDGVVKLLDFGIAKLLQPPRITDPESDTATREVGQALTPQFAAPEQLLGQPVTTATDVYSLGLVLYVLLAGRNPRGEGKTAGNQWVKSITEDPPRPSEFATDTHQVTVTDVATNAGNRGASPSSLRRALRGDLDNILCKALKPEPGERYATVTDFASDLRRYLRSEPVIARPDTLAYRTHRFVRRNRGGVAAGLLMLFALIGATVVTGLQMLEARRQRDAALYQLQRAEASNEFTSILLAEVGPSGKPLTPVELLDAGVNLLERQYGGDQRFLGRMLYETAHRYMDLSKQDSVLSLLARAESIARAIPDHDLLASVQCATAVERVISDPADARQRVDEAQRLLAGLDNATLASSAQCLRARAKLLEADGDIDGSLAAMQAALQKLEQSPVQLMALQLAVMSEIGEMQFKTDRATDSLAINQRILDLLDRSGRGGTMRKVLTLMDRSAILSRAGEIASAAQLQQDAHARVRELEIAGNAPIGMSLHYANSLLRLGRREEALVLLKAVGEQSRAADNVRWATFADYMVGRTLIRMGRLEDAVPWIDSAEKAWRTNEGTNQRALNELELSRADILYRRGDFDAAVKRVDAVLARAGYPQEKKAPGLSSSLLMAARIHLAANDAASAEQFAADSLQIAIGIARDPRMSADVGQSTLMRAKARASLGNSAAAIEDAQQSIESLKNGFGADHEDVKEAQALLASLTTTN